MNSASNALRGKRLRAPRMTVAEFMDWLKASKADIYRKAPYGPVACDCGDVNCRGWKLVEIPSRVSRA